MRYVVPALAAALVSVACPAFAEGPASAPRWKSEPTEAELTAAIPAAARAAGVGGRAVARCRLTTSGETAGCVVARETTPRSGFGEAALALAAKYRAAPQASESIVEIPFDWYPADVNADWLKRPTSQDLITVWPTEAWKKNRGGWALISCLVTTSGVLTDCVVVDETPPGEKFGGAAIALTPQFLMKPARLKGQPAPQVVRIPISFKAMPGMNLAGTVQQKLAPVVQAWPEAPTYAQVAEAYPAKAKAAKLGGRATVDCTVRKDGRLGPCTTVAEEPKGHGFGKAARDLSKLFRMNNVGADGKVVHPLGVQLPFAFDPKMLESPVVGRPTWIAMPPADDLIAAFGELKLTAITRSLLDCEVKASGYLADCKVASETPPGNGVGAAALKVSSKFRLSTWTNEGLPTVGARVRVPIRYDP